jgi:hypothetical protein
MLHYSMAKQSTELSVAPAPRILAVVTRGVDFGGVFRDGHEGRVARPIEDLDEDTLKAIAGSAIGIEHAHLNRLVKDWTP